MTLARLNAQQQRWWQFYTGRDPELRGNATRSYMRAYGTQNERVAQVGGSRLLHHPVIAPLLEKVEAKAVEAAGIDAQFVLDQSLRLYDTAMGDLPVSDSVTDVDQHGRETVKQRHTRSYDPRVALKALDLIGNNKHVQAFQQNIEVSHTHYLEERLAAKSKAIEGRAQRISEERGSIEPEVKKIAHEPGEKTSCEIATPSGDLYTDKST